MPTFEKDENNSLIWGGRCYSECVPLALMVQKSNVYTLILRSILWSLDICHIYRYPNNMVHNTDYVYGVRDDGQHAHKNNVFQIKKDFFWHLNPFLWLWNIVKLYYLWWVNNSTKKSCHASNWCITYLVIIRISCFSKMFPLFLASFNSRNVCSWI